MTKDDATTLLKKVVKRFGAAAVGRKIHVPARTVQRWASGENLMPAAGRAAFLAIYQPAVKAVAKEPRTTTPPLSKERLLELIGVLHERIMKADDDEASHKEIAALANAYTSAERQYARVAGEFTLTESMIVRSAPFARAIRIVREVLAKYPAAAKELDDRLEAFAEDGGS